MIGGGPYFWSSGSYAVGNGTWKGHLRTNQPHALCGSLRATAVGRAGSHQWFHQNIANDRAEVFETTVAGTRSLSFRATLKKLVEC